MLNHSGPDCPVCAESFQLSKFWTGSHLSVYPCAQLCGHGSKQRGGVGVVEGACVWVEKRDIICSTKE